MLFLICLACLLPATVYTQDFIEDCVDIAGAKHKLGESYIGPDGCNQCKCMAFGSGCTKKFCDPTAPKVAAEANKCVDNMGNLHEVGDSYTHVDGCNTCSCKDFGGSCTRRLCMKMSRELPSMCNDTMGKPKNLEESWLAADGCNKCTCGSLGAICTQKLCLTSSGSSGVIHTEHGDIADETGDSPCRLDTGVTKFPGDTWLTQDSCNACTCTGLNGKIDCTNEGCRVRLLRLTEPDKEFGSGSMIAKISSFLPVILILIYAY